MARQMINVLGKQIITPPQSALNISISAKFRNQLSRTLSNSDYTLLLFFPLHKLVDQSMLIVFVFITLYKYKTLAYIQTVYLQKNVVCVCVFVVAEDGECIINVYA